MILGRAAIVEVVGWEKLPRGGSSMPKSGFGVDRQDRGTRQRGHTRGRIRPEGTFCDLGEGVFRRAQECSWAPEDRLADR